MTPLNYCRNLLLYADRESTIKRRSVDAGMHLARTLARASQKFLLPEGGFLLDDSGLRAIDETIELSLPHDIIALEFPRHYTKLDGERSRRKAKGIVFAQQFDTEICLSVADWLDDGTPDGLWVAPETRFFIPRVGYMDRTISGDGGFPGLRMRDSDTGWLDAADNYYHQRILLSFINALSCSNVRVDRIAPKKQHVKSALPFDTYHILMVEVSSAKCSSGASGASGASGHRSPREHLRRGHIRRYESGLKIWVNAHVVNAGVGGKITKDYALRNRTAPAQAPA